MAYDPSFGNKRETSVVPKPKITNWHRLKEFMFMLFLVFAVRIVMVEANITFGHLPVIDDIILGIKGGFDELKQIVEFYF
jgi:hypothetical protein